MDDTIPNDPERTRQVLNLRTRSPMRPPAKRTDDLDGLALFDHVRSPWLL